MPKLRRHGFTTREYHWLQLCRMFVLTTVSTVLIILVWPSCRTPAVGGLIVCE